MPKQTPERQRKPNAFAGFTPLQAPVPAMLDKAIGYNGDARFVSFQWTPSGDEAEYSDGRLSATGNWQAFLAYIHHPAVSPYLREYDLGSSDSEATHALVLDREKREVLIAPVKDAQTFLTEQWPPEPALRMSREAYLAMLSKTLKKVKAPDEVDIEEIQRRIEAQYALVEALQQWLDKLLKNEVLAPGTSSPTKRMTVVSLNTFSLKKREKRSLHF